MPFPLSVMAVMLNQLMIAAGIIVATASVYDRYTWHSARVTLACQLRKLQYGWDKNHVSPAAQERGKRAYLRTARRNRLRRYRGEGVERRCVGHSSRGSAGNRPGD